MNEITHRQAQFLIRQAVDRRLPEEQWSTLQVHLERCETCRAYQSRLGGLERDLRRALRDHRRGSELRATDAARRVLAARPRRKERRRSALYGVLGLAALILLVVSGLPRRVFAPRPASTPIPATPAPSPTPDARFVGILAFESRQSGSSDIYLLNATPNGRELVDLTPGPSEDTSPVWSPDGAWLAYLSDRSGKPELYAISVAGTRLTQLTDEADIAWQAPLAWTSDGRWIALVGERRSQDGEPWVYLVPLDGSGPVALAGTRGARGPLNASPDLPLIAMQAADGGLLAYSTSSGWSEQTVAARDLPGGSTVPAFDWGLGGDSLVYLQETSQGSQVFWKTVLASQAGETGPRADARQITAGAPGQYRSITFEPGGMRIATLKQSPSGGSPESACSTVQVFYAFLYDQTQEVNLPGLCVRSDLERASWVPRGAAGGGAPGGWLAAAAAPASGTETSPGIYVIEVPVRPDASPAQVFERLADLAPEDHVAPRVRPSGKDMGLQPLPGAANLASDPHPPAEALPGLPGRLLLVQPDAASGGVKTAVLTANPDGSAVKQVLPADAYNACPAWSPDRSQIAFLSDRASRADSDLPRRGPEDVFVMDADGQNIVQVTRASVTGRAATIFQQRYTCPVWSPDGQYLAVVSQIGTNQGVMVFTPRGMVIRYGPTDEASFYAGLAWTPDGRSILMAEPAIRGIAPRIVRVAWRDPVAPSTLQILNGWEDVHALSISPDGSQFAFLLVRAASGGRPADAVLRVVRFSDLKIVYSRQILGYDPNMAREPGHIFWLPDRNVVFAAPQGPLSRSKARIIRYSPTDDTLQYLATPPDAVTDWTLNGAWLVYASESGLWGLPLVGRFDRPVSPLRLSGGMYTDLNWR